MRPPQAFPSTSIDGNLRLTLARILACNSGEACWEARARAFLALLGVSMGYDRSGPAKSEEGRALRALAVSLAMSVTLSTGFYRA